MTTNSSSLKLASCEFDREKEIKKDIEKVLAQMCFGRGYREYSEDVINDIFATLVIQDKCVEDCIKVDEDMIITALMEIAFRKSEYQKPVTSVPALVSEIRNLGKKCRYNKTYLTEDTVLQSYMEDADYTGSGIADHIFEIWQNSGDRTSVEAMFHAFADIPFAAFVEEVHKTLKCESEDPHYAVCEEV